MRIHRLVLLAAAPLALAAMLGSASPASAMVWGNSLSSNALNSNALNSNALATTGSAMDDLDGIQVEAVTLPADAR